MLIDILVCILIIIAFCFGYYFAIYSLLKTKNEKTKAKIISAWEYTKKVIK